MKENFPHNEEDKVLFELRQEIAGIAKEELEKKKKRKKYDPHFKNFNPQELTNEDLSIYKKFKEGTLTEEDFENWSKTISKDLGPKIEEIKKEFDYSRPELTRLNFSAWLSNKIINWEDYHKKIANKYRRVRIAV